MPVIKNRMFQPLGVMLSDGTMLHMPPRAQCEVAVAELDAPHLRATLASGQLARLDPADGARQASGPLLEPASLDPPGPETAAASAPRLRKARKA